MTELSSNQKSFVDFMLKSDDHARRGFDLLVKQPNPESFFEALTKAGFFAAGKNPAPAAANEKGYFHVPQWSALVYLSAVAKVAGNNSDEGLAEGLLKILREVTNSAKEDRSSIGPRDNYHTWWRFAEVFGQLPLRATSGDDIALIETWLQSKFDRGLVAHELDKGLLAKLLSSDLPADWSKACVVLRLCTDLRQTDSASGKRADKNTIPVVEDHWLGELLGHHSNAFGAKCGKEAS